MRLNIVCPACGTASAFFLAQTRYQGPYRCWKCSEYCTIKVGNGKLKSCQPLSQADYKRQQEKKAVRRKKPEET